MRSSFEVVVVVIVVVVVVFFFFFNKVLVSIVNSAQDPLLFQLKSVPNAH